jgi:methyl-branched lipid omega-hydroxylase
VTTAGLSIVDAEFWRRPLAERMVHFAELREQGPFVQASTLDPLVGEDIHFSAVTRYQEVTEISRRPADFCSGRGSTAITDLPADALEFFSSFIVMDDPRHARQRGIVSRAFTPARLRGVLDSVERICTELIDGFCERGEIDLVEEFSEPFPLLVICDMIGIPRSEFSTVLQATNVILGAGDEEVLGGQEDILVALLEAGAQMGALMNDIAERRRREPADDLMTALVHSDVGEDWLGPDELVPFFILLTTAGNDTTRNAISHGIHLLSQYPAQRAAWQQDPEALTATGVEEIVRMASPVTFMRRTVTRDLTLSGQEFAAGDRVVLFYGSANRDPAVFTDPERFDVRRSPNPHVGFGGPGPHFCLGAHLARRELAVAVRQLLGRLPDIDLAGEPELLQALGIPLVGGIKRLPVRFTPTARSAS